MENDFKTNIRSYYESASMRIKTPSEKTDH